MNHFPGPIKLEFKFEVSSFPAPETIEEMLNMFPRDMRPSVSKVAHLAEPLNTAYVVLTILAIGGWAGQKILGPLLEEVGNCLREAVKAYLKRRKQLVAVGLHIINFENVEIRIGIGVNSLVNWKDEDEHFKKLAEYIVGNFEEVTSRDPDRVRLSWDPASESWTFCEIWPTNMSSSHEYYIYDARTGMWEKHSLDKED
jgi:hypothetical protein